MASETPSIYTPLPTKTSIRVLLLAPGPPEDEIHAWLLPINLDADHKLFPSTTPRPTDSISVVCGKTTFGTEREFILPIDIYFDDDNDLTPMHPFQRYTALSYVWGSTENPEYINLDGDRFAVTRNLYGALKSLRSRSKGKCLWIDAICINQQDFEEKISQIGLMKRVYRQAEKVVAYVPLNEVDQDNIPELVSQIWSSKRKLEEASKRKESVKAKLEVEGDGKLDSQTGGRNEEISLISIPDLKPSMVDIDTQGNFDSVHSIKEEALIQQKLRTLPENAQFLEDFGLPPVDSSLWASWRRFFASPYFRRVWILQEFALASKLRFCIGSKILDMEPVIVAYHFVKEHSGAFNAHYLGHSHEGDPEDLSRLATTGGLGLEMMFMERVLAREENLTQGLIEKLRRIRSFDATDPRDKIYALLGLAKDGDEFAEHISYAHDETPAKVFTRFARVFIERGHVFEVLLQAGLGSCEMSLPSWVPNWATSSQTTGTLPSLENKSSKQTKNTQILPNNNLLIHGILTDSISHVSQPFNQIPTETSSVTPPGSKLIDIVRGLVKAFILVLSNYPKAQSVDGVFDLIFRVLVQKETTFEAIDNAETRGLRIGFGAFLGLMKTWGSKMADLERGKLLVVDCSSPEESRMFNQFLQMAFQTTGYKRFCITRNGRVGLVPYRSEVGDLVAVFDGCDSEFILRDMSDDVNGEDDERKRYSLVGSGYMKGLKEDGETSSKAEIEQEIRLV